MKQESTKKTPKWLLPVIIGAAVLVIAGILLAIFLLPQGTGSENVQSKLYWNVDRLANLEEETNMSIRQPGADGLYTIRFAVDGEQVEYQCADKRLVNQIDFLDVMGLVFDGDGLIIGALDPTQVAVEVARDFFVRSFDGNTIVVNSSQAMNGMTMDITVTANTGVYDVAPGAAVVGQKTTDLNLLDKVTVYANAEGENTHVFVTGRAKSAGAYYRVDRFYDSDLASTTREPDENGAYSILFAHDGEQVTLKCKDKDLVSTIDAGTDAKVQMGLVLDEEGYIIEKISISEALKGKLLYSMYNVTAVDGTLVTLESQWSGNKDKGEIKDLTLPEDFKDIFLMETDCGAEFIGQRVDGLQLGDRVYVYSDFDNKPVLIYITRRTCDYPFYFNISRSYSTKRQETSREPENGWYIFEMAKEGGKLVTLKTKDKELASEVDRYDPAYMGLKVENGIILDTCDPQCITGRSGYSNRYVTEMLGSIVRFATASDLTSGSNMMLAQDCKIYDVTGAYGVNYMTETELKMSDRVGYMRNPANEVTTIFIYDRYEEGAKIYYNISRKYSSKLKSTTREPDAEGYYVFDMTCEGKEVQVKTKSKALATYIDKVSAKLIALRVSNGIVKAAYNRYYDSIEYGNKSMSGVYFDHIDADGKVHYYTMSNGERVDGVSSYSVAKDYVVYNNSNAYINNRGQKDKLQKDDYIYTVTSRAKKEILQIFIRTRKVDAPLYWKTQQKYNSTTGETTRKPDAEGYYVFDVVANGEIKTFKTKDKDLASRVDYYAYAFTMITKGDIILAVCDATDAKGVDKHLYRFTYVKEIKGNTVITYTTSTTSENYGKDLELKFTKNSKISDVCTYSDGFGKATTLVPGDRVVSYVDADENVLYCFVDYKCTRTAGPTGLCEHCGEVVNWTPFAGTIATQDMHYYLPNDRSRTQRTIGYTAAELATDPSLKQYKTCFDLNGHTLTSSDRNFFIYSELNLMDSAGGGKLISADDSTALRTSFSSDAKINIYGGTYQKAEGVGKVGSGALIYGGGCTINIYDGTFVGGNASIGGIANIGTGSTLNIEGGTFISGTADQGNSIYIKGSSDAPSTLALRNCKIDGGVDPDGVVNIYLGSNVEIGNAKNAGLKLQPGKLVDVSKLDTTSSIYVNTLGVFTTERDDIETVKDVFKGIDEFSKVQVEGKALAINVVVTADPETDTQKRVDKWVDKVKADGSFAAGGMLPKTCPICNGEAVIWEVAAPGMTVAKTGGHYYFNSEDGNVSYESFNLLTTSSSAEKACVYLNDQNITMLGRIRARGEMNFFGNGTITKLDNDKVASDGTKYALYGMFELARTNTAVNIYGGNYVSQVKLQESGNNPNGTPLFRVNFADTAVNIYDGTFTMEDGTAGAVFHGLEACEFNLYGGTFNGGSGYVDGGNTYGGSAYLAAGSLNVDGGVITGGSAANGANIYAKNAAVTLKDAAVEGVELAGQSNLTLSGNVQLPDLKLAAGIIADITELDTASAITVEAEGIFTTERDDIDTVKACFLPAEEINVSGKALAYGEVTPPAPPAQELPEITADTFTTGWAPNAEGYAYCEACYKQAIAAGAAEQAAKEAAWHQWTAYDAALTDDSGNIFETGHFYLTKNETAAKKRFLSPYGNYTVCLNLNGFSVTKDADATTGPLFRVAEGASFNLMDAKGTGILTGRNSAGNAVGAVFATDYASATINIYGGILRRTTNASGQRVIAINAGHTLNIYGGTIDARLYDATDVTALAADQTTPRRAGMAIYMVGTDANAKAVANIYDGTIIGGTMLAPYGASTSGGAAIVVGAYAQLNMADGTVRDGVNEATTDLNADNISIAANGEMILSGGTVNGEIRVAAGASLILKNAPVISKPENGMGLNLDDGAIVNIDELTAQAQIAVEGEAGKVISNVSNNASAVKNCFTPGEGLDVIVGSTGALEIAEEGATPPAPVLVMTADPSTAADPLKAMDDNISIVKNWHETVGKTFDTIKDGDGNVSATCPFCSPDTAVTWTPYAVSTTLTDGCHVYVTEDATRNDTNLIVALNNGTKQCVYLNSKNFTGTGAMRIRARYGLNLIAYDSTITRSVECAKTEGFLAPLNAVSNFYGGTYINNDPDVALLRSHANAMDVRLYDVTLTGNAGNVVDDAGSYSGKITFYGGSVTGTVAQTKDASILQIFSSQTNPAVFTGSVTYAEQSVLTLVGNPTIGGTGLTLPGAAVLNIDKLNSQAQITISAEEGDVISNVSDNAANVTGCFIVPDGLTVEVDANGALAVVTNEVDPAAHVKAWYETNKAAFRAEGKLEAGATVEAPCPFCSPDANVTWTGINSNANLVDGCHVYWVADWQKNSTHNYVVGVSSASSHCVYLNGFNAGGEDYKGTNRIRARGGLNLIAYGSTVTRIADGKGSADEYPAVIQAEGIANIYGGTYISARTDTSLIRTSYACDVTIYDAQLQAVGGNAISVRAGTTGTLTLYNCTLTGETCPVLLTEGGLAIHNGSVACPITVSEGASLTLSGKPAISSLTLNGAAVANVDGLKKGAQIAVAGEAGKVISNVSENVSTAQKCFTAGEGLEVVVADGALVIAQAVAPAQTVVENPVQEASKAVKN